MDSDLFPAATPADVSLNDQIACVEREIRMRERVYRWTAIGKLTQDAADREILCMRAVLATLQTK